MGGAAYSAGSHRRRARSNAADCSSPAEWRSVAVSFPSRLRLCRSGGPRLQFDRPGEVALRGAMKVLRVGRYTHAAGELEVQFCPVAKICRVIHGALSNSGDARPWRAKLLKVPRWAV